MNVITRTARIVTGLLFIFSGFVKGIDPLGTAFKFSDYFKAFNLAFLDDLSLPLSLILCLMEFITGMMLLSGSFVRTASWIAALMMALFTPLTLVLALFNPVSDCGCFGDAIHMTNWQTFFKNIALTLVVIVVFIRRHDRAGLLPPKPAFASTAASAIIFLLFMWYNLAYLPVIDFRPYRVGTSLPEAMSVPPDAPADEYDIRFIYEKDGIQKEFTLNDYPANDTTWKFIDQKSVLITRGYVPPIHDFRLVTGDGVDMTENITRSSENVLLLVARRLEESDREGLLQGYDLCLTFQEKGMGFYIVTASTHETAGEIAPGFNLLFADEITLKTVIRSDPGFVLLQDGTVMAKWSMRNLPDKSQFEGDLNALAIRSLARKKNTMTVITSVLIVSLIIALFARFRLTEISTT
ncbi:MAG: DoxX family protein [Bacteroidales bacterium]|nr:DoxX family protein [Bacteroidales bacterium]